MPAFLHMHLVPWGCTKANLTVWTVRDGYAVTFRQYQGDQQTEDEFWSEPV
jgi:hypothetical protein